MRIARFVIEQSSGPVNGRPGDEWQPPRSNTRCPSRRRPTWRGIERRGGPPRLILFSRIEDASRRAGTAVVRVDAPSSMPEDADLVLVDWSARESGSDSDLRELYAVRDDGGAVRPPSDLEAHAAARLRSRPCWHGRSWSPAFPRWWPVTAAQTAGLLHRRCPEVRHHARCTSTCAGIRTCSCRSARSCDSSGGPRYPRSTVALR